MVLKSGGGEGLDGGGGEVEDLEVGGVCGEGLEGEVGEGGGDHHQVAGLLEAVEKGEVGVAGADQLYRIAI